jgi:hypothetical protein
MRTSEIATDPLYIMAGEIHDALRDHGHDESSIYSIMHYGTIIADLRMREEARKAEDARAEANAERYVQELAGAVVR